MRITQAIASVFLCIVCLNVYAFDPPDKAVRLKAIGSTKYLPGIDKRIFAPSECFQAIPRPGRSDWLAKHKEHGQSYDQFVSIRYPKPSKYKDTLYIQPLGDFGEKAPSLDVLLEYAEIYFGMPVKSLQPIDPKQIKLTSRINPRGNVYQLQTGDILKYLSRHKPNDAYLVLGVTMTDLYPDPTWNFVFGQANYANQVGVFSFARYHPDFYGVKVEGNVDTLILERSLKVMCHEMGHMFGIGHCIYFHCLMNGSNHLEESDRSPHYLCPVCLRKLHHQKPMDLMTRYQKLQKFYTEHKIQRGIEFTNCRLKAHK